VQDVTILNLFTPLPIHFQLNLNTNTEQQVNSLIVVVIIICNWKVCNFQWRPLLSCCLWNRTAREFNSNQLNLYIYCYQHITLIYIHYHHCHTVLRLVSMSVGVSFYADASISVILHADVHIYFDISVWLI